MACRIKYLGDRMFFTWFESKVKWKIFWSFCKKKKGNLQNFSMCFWSLKYSSFFLKGRWNVILRVLTFWVERKNGSFLCNPFEDCSFWFWLSRSIFEERQKVTDNYVRKFFLFWKKTNDCVPKFWGTVPSSSLKFQPSYILISFYRV